jgi:alpha-tubulin suppressor-like RCC1 family protein
MRGLAWRTVLVSALVALGPALPARAASVSASDHASGGHGVAGKAQRERPSSSAVSLTPSATKPYWSCPSGLCEAIIDPRPVRVAGRYALPAGSIATASRTAEGLAAPMPGGLAGASLTLEGSGELGGYDPQDLQSAYRIPPSGGEEQTIAVVDAYGDELAEADLAHYRERYGLPPCTHADGCFRKVNQQGAEAGYPEFNSSWALETALDLDMAAAACPHCHLLLVEAGSEDLSSLAAAVNTAAGLGASEISNSYGTSEESQQCNTSEAIAHCLSYSHEYDHPGVLVTAAAGDSMFPRQLGPDFPASSPHVVAVGGTSLHRAPGTGREWSEQVWFEGPEEFAFNGPEAGSGSGCSLVEPKPSWQSDTGCTHRTGNDVAAVAACETPVSVYFSADGRRTRVWVDVCGTSVSSPLVAGIEAHASAAVRSLPGAEAFYRDPGDFFDVTEGENCQCQGNDVPEYLWHAGVGYDGPTGNGTPDGPLALGGAATVLTGAASGVSADAATLNGTVAPNGLATSYRFEYGTTTSYGTSVPVPDASAGSGGASKPVSAALTGLARGRTYHFRLVATNGAGTSVGEDGSFDTARPAVIGVTPDSGSYRGGNAVRIAGSGFAGVTAVRFGAAEASRLTVESEGSISAVAPRWAGTVNITVTTVAGTSAISAADRYTYVTGPVVAWGENSSGQLGDGMKRPGSLGFEGENSDLIAPVFGLGEAVALAAGDGHSLALLADGTVMAWGSNADGELGNGRVAPTQIDSLVPVKVCAVGVSQCPQGPYLEHVVAIAAGSRHSLALLRNRTVVAWGANSRGQLGTCAAMTAGGCPACPAGALCNEVVPRSAVPVPVCTVNEATSCGPEHQLKEVAAISAGGDDSLALLKDGTVVAWGENTMGQLGDGVVDGPEACTDPADLSLEGVGKHYCSTIPIAVSGVSSVKAVAAGGDGSLALRQGGTVVTWGQNTEGQLGNGSFAGPETCTEPAGSSIRSDRSAPCSRVPVAVTGLRKVRAIAAGGGIYPLTELLSPLVEGLEGRILSQHDMALSRRGTVMAWGDNVFGQLGDGGTDSSDVPVAVCAVGTSGQCPSAHHLDDVSAIAAYGDLSGALLADGAVVSWGDNEFHMVGELGDGSFTGPEKCAVTWCSRTPGAVVGTEGVTAFALGEHYGLATTTQLRRHVPSTQP